MQSQIFFTIRIFCLGHLYTEVRWLYCTWSSELVVNFLLMQLCFSEPQVDWKSNLNHKATEPLYHTFMYSFVSLLSGIYPISAIHSLLVTLYVTEYLIIQICIQYFSYKKDFITLNKSVINHLPRCTYHLLYLWYSHLSQFRKFPSLKQHL